MNRTPYIVALIAVLSLLVTAQDNGATPSVTASGGTASESGRTGSADWMRPGNVPFCPPSTCLYYAGDYDPTDSNANGLFNADYTTGQLEGQAWVGVKPNHDAIITGATFVQIFTSGFQGTNPTPFAIQVGINPGQAGTTVCNTSGNATLKLYFVYNEIPIYSYTIKKLAKPCRLKKGRVYYVNLLPISGNGYGYVLNVVDAQPKNHYGWKNDLNDCYFNSATYGSDYVPCNSVGPFSELSIALTGKE